MLADYSRFQGAPCGSPLLCLRLPSDRVTASGCVPHDLSLVIAAETASGILGSGGSRFHAQVSVDGRTAGPDDLSDVRRLEAPGSQFMCSLDLLVA